ncbi:hypothetical protein Dimus_024580, partial [Dionaea muscipula]
MQFKSASSSPNAPYMKDFNAWFTLKPHTKLHQFKFLAHLLLHAYCFFSSTNYTQLKYMVHEAARLLYSHSQREAAVPCILLKYS